MRPFRDLTEQAKKEEAEYMNNVYIVKKGKQLFRNKRRKYHCVAQVANRYTPLSWQLICLSLKHCLNFIG